MKDRRCRLVLPLVLALSISPGPSSRLGAQEPDPEAARAEQTWAAFELADLIAERRRSERAYLRFLKVPTLSTGIYELAAGARDPQGPHLRDEVYYVVEGKASLQVDGQDRAVAAGTIVYVKAGVEHHFHSIEKDLTVLVVFAAPATGG